MKKFIFSFAKKYSSLQLYCKIFPPRRVKKNAARYYDLTAFKPYL